MPSAEKPGQTRELYVSIYVNCSLRNVQIERVFHPDGGRTDSDQTLPYLIPEEAEKISSRVPVWKIELVRDSLPYIITSEDTGEKEDGYEEY